MTPDFSGITVTGTGVELDRGGREEAPARERAVAQVLDPRVADRLEALQPTGTRRGRLVDVLPEDVGGELERREL